MSVVVQERLLFCPEMRRLTLRQHILFVSINAVLLVKLHHRKLPSKMTKVVFNFQLRNCL